MSLQHFAPVWLSLTEGNVLKASTMKTKVHATNAAKQTYRSHLPAT
jgi:hypothetical protein